MRANQEAPKIGEQLHARSSAVNIMTRGFIETIIFRKRTVHADHERDATTDLAITLSSMLPQPSRQLTEYSAPQSILRTALPLPGIDEPYGDSPRLCRIGAHR